MSADNVSIPIAWLVGGLWAVTMALAGALGTAMCRRLAEMADSIERLADTSRRLEIGHARVEESISSISNRVGRLEDDAA